jgi:hypothetical protein
MFYTFSVCIYRSYLSLTLCLTHLTLVESTIIAVYCWFNTLLCCLGVRWDILLNYYILGHFHVIESYHIYWAKAPQKAKLPVCLPCVTWAYCKPEVLNLWIANVMCCLHLFVILYFSAKWRKYYSNYIFNFKWIITTNLQEWLIG